LRRSTKQYKNYTCHFICRENFWLIMWIDSLWEYRRHDY
jgi:hypothetical protein